MEKLLSLYNIRTVRYTDSEHNNRIYAFTHKMFHENIFIEYFYVNPDDDDIVEDENTEFGGQLSLIMKQQGFYYQFLMYRSAFEVSTPVMLLQTILFLVKTVEDIRPDQLVEYFSNMASDPLIPHQIPDKEFRDTANKMLKLKLERILDLIQADNAELN